ncbi:Uu.00g023010.m01.CDS01 [Anthostomella pinea]|uniref:Uu.00g023010.m01.CDS01 n=1 Tax=Anthostomella pinea TaxID=933095 RepID=A0AAI8W018_9PEZI|nr:Uu.00g023010.m01.CDS01 [Anthostomella pinea]
MKALVLDAGARTAHLSHIPQPRPGPREFLVQVQAISLNPIDPLYVAHPLASSGRTIGSDLASTIAVLGEPVSLAKGLKEGVKVAGFLQGTCSVNDRPNAFAEFLVVPSDLVWRVPDGVTTEEAAGISLVALTAAQAIWYRLGLPAPFEYDRDAVLDEHPEWTLNIFIYGASTSVGLYAAQMARLSAKATGKTIRLFGAASRAHWQMLQSSPYAYDHLVDYRDNDWPSQIVALSNEEGMDYVYDYISEGSSVSLSASTLSERPGAAMASVRSREGRAWSTAQPLKVEPIYGAVWEGLGEEVQYQGLTVKASPAARGFAVKFYEWLGKALGDGLKAAPIRLMPGGLEKVVGDGFALLGAGGMTNRTVERNEVWMKPTGIPPPFLYQFAQYYITFLVFSYEHQVT